MSESPIAYVRDPEDGEVVANLWNEEVTMEFENHAYWEVERS